MNDRHPIVLLDTNALMMPTQLNVRLFEELERLLGGVDVVVPDVVMTELSTLAESGSADERRAARVGRTMAEAHARTIATGDTDADPAIESLANAGRADYVVTNDRPLRDRVLDAAIPVISLRGRTKLAIIHP